MLTAVISHPRLIDAPADEAIETGACATARAP